MSKQSGKQRNKSDAFSSFVFSVQTDEPVTIFIPDTYISECTVIDDLFEHNLMSCISNDVVDSSIMSKINDSDLKCSYDKIPSTFYDVKSWPKSTNLLCWTCHSKFDTKPLFLPNTVESSPTRDDPHRVIMSTEGCFCSYSHIVDYIYLWYPQHERISKNSMVEYLYMIFEKKRPKKILPSTSIFEQEQYGGTLTKEQFNNMIPV